MQQYQQALHTLPLTYMDREIAPESVFLQDNVASGQLRLPSLDASIWACHSKLHLQSKKREKVLFGVCYTLKKKSFYWYVSVGVQVRLHKKHLGKWILKDIK